MSAENNDRTPVTFRAYLTVEQRRSAKAIAALRGLNLREFWEEAMEEHVKRRVECEKKGEVFNYVFVPRNVQSVSIYADEGLVAEVDEWAERDVVKKDDALYSAFSRHVELWAEKVMSKQ